MRVTIHRGTHEIGGSCIEVVSGGARLLLDAGLALDASPRGDLTRQIPPSLRLEADDELCGVVVTHGHLDHFGLIGALGENVDLYMGVRAHAILAASAFFSPAGLSHPLTRPLTSRRPQMIGPFRVTPYRVDHSAFDAYSLLVEADGRRLFYSGDLRAHGRKPGAWSELIDRPPEHVDVMIMEGTRLGQPDPRACRSEREVEECMRRTISRTRGAVVVVASAQNIDRLVSVYRASRRAHRTLVADLYSATVAEACGNSNIPQPGFDHYCVYVPNRQRVLVRNAGEFDRVDALGRTRIFPAELRRRRSELVLVMPSSTLPELLRADVMDEATLVWSIWKGYLTRDTRLDRYRNQPWWPPQCLHTSGHADPEDLRRLVEAIDPTTLVPIHTAAPERFGDLFPRVAQHEDGILWEV